MGKKKQPNHKSNTTYENETIPDSTFTHERDKENNIDYFRSFFENSPLPYQSLDKDGNPAYLLGISEDITERKSMLEKLKAEELKFRTLAENSPDNIARYDTNCRRIYINPNMEKILGLKASETLGRTSTEKLLFNDTEKYKEKILEVLQTGEGAELDIVLPDTKEGIRYHNIHFTAEFSSSGSIIGVLAIGRDVTERIIAQQKIKNINKELEKRVSERTQQLKVANKELESFAYSVSHDLRAPLRSIDGFSQILLEDYNEKLDADGKDYLGRVRKSAQRMAILIDDLLQLSRISRDNINIDTINISNIAHNIIKELKEASPERKVQIKIKDGLSAKADSRLIKIVLENLWGNA